MSHNDPNQDDQSHADSANANLPDEAGTHWTEHLRSTNTPAESESTGPTPSGSGRKLRVATGVFLLLIVVAGAALFVWQRRVSKEMRDNLPQLDGTLTVYGLTAPVTIARDTHGVPHIHASSMNDLVFAQGYVTAQDRLWQMDMLRRHAAGAFAAILGRGML